MASAGAFLTVAVCLLTSAPQGDPLAGTVKSIDGAPVPGARVVLISATRLETTTDAGGAFRFDEAVLPADLEVTAPGFASMRRHVTGSPIHIVIAPASIAESVLVTADRPPAWREPASGATVLSGEDLDLIPAATADEALRVVSGFSLFRRSSSRASNPTTHGVTLRGLSASGASRGLVLLDGVPMNDGFGGWVTWTRLPADAIDRVDVERGAEGDAFGSDALGGVIRIVTPEGARPSLAVAGQFGTSRWDHTTDPPPDSGLGAADMSAGGAWGRAQMFGAVSWFQTDGVIPLEPASRGSVDQPADAEWASVLGRASARWGSRRVTIAGWYGEDDRGNGTLLQVNRMSGGTVAGTFEAIGSTSSVAARVSVSPNNFYQTFSSISAGRLTETLTSAQTTDNTTTRALVEVGRTIGRGHVLARGMLTRAAADYQVETAAATTVRSLADDAEAISIHAGFAPAARLSVSAGVRHEWRAAPEETSDRDGATVGHVGGTWRANDRVHLRGSAATSHRWPTLNELVRNFQAGAILTVANPDLKPERAVSFDGGVTIDGQRWQLSVGGFHTTIDDAITNVTQTATRRQRQNAGEAHVTGGELDAEYRPTATARVRGSLSLIDARFRNAVEPALEGKRLPQVPQASFSLAADVRLPGGIAVSGVFRTLSTQFDDDRNAFELASAAQLDLRVAGRFGRVGWFALVENMADARFEVGRTPLVTLAPGRSVRMGVSWRWNER
jgi:outer membrane receptor protein involved in Fe transport